MTEMVSLNISVSIAELTKRMKAHLSVIGKRARTVSGESMFGDITVSPAEEQSVFPDLLRFASQTICDELQSFCGGYMATDGQITFTINATRRWDKEGILNLTNALCNAVASYLYLFATGEYLSIIRPSTGEKYPPIYGSTYRSQCAAILKNIIGLCNVKRPVYSSKSYADVSAEVTERTVKNDYEMIRIADAQNCLLLDCNGVVLVVNNDKEEE